MPAPPPALSARAAFVLLILGGGAFAALAADLLLHGPVTAADAAISAWLHGNARPLLTSFMAAVSALHATRTLLALAAAAALALLWRGRYRWVALLAACVPGGMLLNYGVKHAFQRARPALDGVAAIGSYSFPSGHTAGATVWWGFVLVWLLAHARRPAERAAAITLTAGMVALTALSRVYLGAHFASDVLAAVAEGAVWLALCFLALGRRIAAA